MTHYIAIFVEDGLGEWRAVFPDLPGCEARGFSLEDAGFAAATALRQCIEDSGVVPAPPMDMTTIQRSKEWLSENHIDLTKAVVSMIPLAA